MGAPSFVEPELLNDIGIEFNERVKKFLSEKAE